MTEIHLTALLICIVIFLIFAFIFYRVMCALADSSERWEEIIEDDDHIGI